MVKDNSMSDNISSDLIYIIDKSGSMAGAGEEPKQALNGSILEQKAVPGSENSTYSIYTFSDKVTLSVDDRKLSDAVEFEDYKPDGMTALNDAICIAIKNKLAKPNYQYEKRQKDLAKKKKQEEKRLRKLEKNAPAALEGMDQAPNPAPASDQVDNS